MKRILVLLCLSIFAALSLTACSGDDGENGIPGISGTDGKSPIIEVRDATTAECPTGGKVFITGFDDDSNGIVDVIINTSYECNDQELKMSTSACLICHTDYKSELVSSKHYNTSAYAASASCLPCHGKADSFGENADAIDPSKTNGLNCLSCHNYNGNVKHNVVHTAYEVDSFTCGSATAGCHSGTFHTSGHKYTDNASGKWEISAHGFMGNDNLTAMGPHADNACKSCHVGSFFRTYSSKFASASASKDRVWTSSMGTKYGALYEVAFGVFAADGSVINTNEQGFNSLANRSVGCSTCHEPHNLNLRTKAIVSDGTTIVKSFVDGTTNNTIADGAVIFSAEYLLCTSCHAATVEPRFVRTNVFTAVLDEAAQKKGIDNVSFHDNTAARSIADTHFAGKLASTATGNPIATNGGYVPDATFAAGGYVEVKGYGVQVNSSNACSSCHDVHLTSKMGYFNKHSTTDNEVADANIDAYNMYNLTIEAAASNHAGAVNSTNGKQRAGISLHGTCNSCHAAVYASEMVTNRIDPSKPTDRTYSTDTNVMGCATCHDMTMVIDNSTGVQIPRVTGIKGFESNVREKKGTYRLPWGATYTDASKTLSAEDTTKFEKSLLCITCHVTQRRDGAPSLIGQTNAAGVVIESLHNGIHYKENAGAHVLGLYYKGNVPADKEYVVAGAHTNRVAAGVNSCTGCHGVSKDTHVFKATVNNKFTGNAIGCGCHTDNDLSVNADEITKAVAGGAAFYTVGVKLAADISVKATKDNGAIANYSLFNASSVDLAERTRGATIHGGKLAKQVAYDSITQLLLSTATCNTVTVADLATCSLLSANGDDVTALKAWLGSAGSLGR